MLIAQFRLLLQGAQNDGIEAHVNLNFGRGRLELLARQFAGEHLVKHHAQRVNIRAMIHLARRLNLLRRHVLRRAHDTACVGQFGGRAVLLRRLPALADRQVSPTIIPNNNLRQTKIRHLHAATAVQQNILRLDVAVDDALVVRELQRVADLRHDGQRLAGGNAFLRQQLAERDAVHKFHEQIVKSAGLAVVVNGDDVGMVQRGQRAGFFLEPAGELRVVGAFRREEFQRHEAV